MFVPSHFPRHIHNLCIRNPSLDFIHKFDTHRTGTHSLAVGQVDVLKTLRSTFKPCTHMRMQYRTRILRTCTHTLIHSYTQTHTTNIHTYYTSHVQFTTRFLLITVANVNPRKQTSNTRVRRTMITPFKLLIYEHSVNRFRDPFHAYLY